MMHSSVSEMLRAAPKGPFVQGDQLPTCIDACFDCTQACTACADACLGEDKIKMLGRCIRLTQDCAEICASTGCLLSRQQQPDVELLRATVMLCELACRKCAEECEKHAGHHEHCKVCASSCRGCQQSCQNLLQTFDKAKPQQQVRH